MSCPSQKQEQQHSWYGYINHPSSHQQQQQQTYSRSSYYYNNDELSTTYVVPINDENESFIHCQTNYGGGNAYVPTSECHMITSYGDEMSSYQTISTPRKTYCNPIIAAPIKTNLPITKPSLPMNSSSSSCWDWLLFSPQYYSEYYTPSSTYIYQQKLVEEDNNDFNFLANFPTCLLALFYLTPKLIGNTKSDDENDNDQEINSIDKHEQNFNTNRSSTPDTDDGYQSASDASRSDYSQQSSIPSDDITINQHSLPTSLLDRRISYAAAAVKPIITTLTNKKASLDRDISKPKQIINNTLSSPSTILNHNDLLNSNGQKLKFIAPRFERMHHAKQSSAATIKNSPMTSSNRTQIRSTNNNNNNQRNNYVVNPVRRR